jgi:hypothetical protein
LRRSWLPRWSTREERRLRRDRRARRTQVQFSNDQRLDRRLRTCRLTCLSTVLLSTAAPVAVHPHAIAKLVYTIPKSMSDIPSNQTSMDHKVATPKPALVPWAGPPKGRHRIEISQDNQTGRSIFRTNIPPPQPDLDQSNMEVSDSP